MATKRFCKQTVKEHLEQQIDYIEKKYQFDKDNGCAQLGKNPPVEKAIAYGEWDKMRHLLYYMGWF